MPVRRGLVEGASHARKPSITNVLQKNRPKTTNSRPWRVCEVVMDVSCSCVEGGCFSVVIRQTMLAVQCRPLWVNFFFCLCRTKVMGLNQSKANESLRERVCLMCTFFHFRRITPTNMIKTWGYVVETPVNDVDSISFLANA